MHLSRVQSETGRLRRACHGSRCPANPVRRRWRHAIWQAPRSAVEPIQQLQRNDERGEELSVRLRGGAEAERQQAPRRELDPGKAFCHGNHGLW